ncbi:MAG: hypothetical protein V3S39_10420 [Thermodesulfobacteriota bacterium]
MSAVAICPVSSTSSRIICAQGQRPAIFSIIFFMPSPSTPPHNLLHYGHGVQFSGLPSQGFSDLVLIRDGEGADGFEDIIRCH